MLGMPLLSDFRMHTDPVKSWKVTEVKIEILQAWKVVEPEARWSLHFLTYVCQNLSGAQLKHYPRPCMCTE